MRFFSVKLNTASSNFLRPCAFRRLVCHILNCVELIHSRKNEYCLDTTKDHVYYLNFHISLKRSIKQNLCMFDTKFIWSRAGLWGLWLLSTSLILTHFINSYMYWLLSIVLLNFLLWYLSLHSSDSKVVLK